MSENKKTQDALAEQLKLKSEQAAREALKGSTENPHTGPIVPLTIQAPIKQPEGVVHLNNPLLAAHEEGRITDTTQMSVDPKTGALVVDTTKITKPRNHVEEFNNLIREQIKIRKLSVLPRTSYPLPVSPAGRHYLVDDIKFTQIKNLNSRPQQEGAPRRDAGDVGADWVIQLDMNDGQSYQVKL